MKILENTTNMASSTSSQSQGLQQESLTHKFIKRGSWLYIIALLTGPIGYGIKIIISHDLSVSELWVLYGVLSFILLFGSLNDLGMVESLNYFLPKYLSNGNYEKVKSYAFYSFIAMFTMSAVSALALYTGADWLALVYFNASGSLLAEVTAVLQIFALYLVVTNIQHYLSTIAIIYQNTFISKGLELVRLTSSLGFAYTLVTTGGGSLISYAQGWLFGTTVATVFWIIGVGIYYLLPLARSAPLIIDRVDIRKLFAYSGWALLATNASSFLSQIDMQLLLQMRGPEAAGIYSNYLSLMAIPFLVLTPILSLIFPVISWFHGQGNIAKIRMIVGTFTQIFLVAGIMVSGLAVLFAGSLGVFFFGPAYATSGEIVYWSAGFILFNLLLQVNFILLAGIGQVKKRLWIILVGIVLNIILNIIGITFMGAAGSALAVGISWIGIWYMSYWVTREYHGGFEIMRLARAIAAFGILSLAFYSILPRNFDQYVSLASNIGIFAQSPRVLIIFIIGIVSLIYLGVYILLHLREFRDIRRTLASSPS